MPKNWKYIKKLLETEFLAEKLKGRITYDLTNYRPATWYQQHFLMKCDDQTLMEASQRWCSVDHRYRKGMPNASRISARIVEKGYDRYDEDSTKLSEDGVEEIIGAISEYLHNDIEDSLQSGEYFVRALAVVDRRCGKRRLMRYAKQAVSVDDPPWLRRICRTRFEAEGIPYCAAYSEPRS